MGSGAFATQRPWTAALGAVVKGEASRGEPDRDLPRLALVEAVQREERPDPLRRGDRASVAEDVHDRRADLDPLRPREDPVRELKDVGVEPHLADEVGDDRVGVGLLNLGGQVALRDPGSAEAEPVGELNLLEEVEPHLALRRDAPVDLGLTDREENVEFHGVPNYRSGARRS